MSEKAKIEVGFQAFVSDGGEEFGAVREISRDGKTLTVYVENAGDFAVPLSAVKEVTDDKVVLDGSKLAADLRKAIGRAHSGEDPRIP